MTWEVRVGMAGIIAAIGLFVVFNPVSVTTLAVSVIPWLLIGVGVIYVLTTIARRRRRLFSLLLPGLIGALFIIAGLSMKVGEPGTAGPIPLTVVFALLLFGTGTSKAVMALSATRSRYFPLLSGSAAYSLLAGFTIVFAWPTVSAGFIGVVLGLEMIAAALFMAAMALRDRDKEEAREALGLEAEAGAGGKPAENTGKPPEL